MSISFVEIKEEEEERERREKFMTDFVSKCLVAF